MFVNKVKETEAELKEKEKEVSLDKKKEIKNSHKAFRPECERSC